MENQQIILFIFIKTLILPIFFKTIKVKQCYKLVK